MPTFSKNERLCNKIAIQKLFKSGKSFYSYPYRIKWMALDSEDFPEVKVLISVPKKTFKKAVARNLIKRRVREAYRRHKAPLTEAAKKNNKTIHLIIIYTGNKTEKYQLLEQAIISTLKQLIIQIEVANK